MEADAGVAAQQWGMSTSKVLKTQLRMLVDSEANARSACQPWAGHE